MGGDGGDGFDSDALSRLTEDEADLQKWLFQDENAGVERSKHVVSSIIEWLKTSISPY